MSTEFVDVHPWFTQTLEEICQQQGISLRGLSHNWLWELEKNGVKKRVLGTAFELNTAMASGIARDKVATYELLKAYGVPAIAHYVFQPASGTVLGGEMDWAKGVVMKPINGQNARGVQLLFDQQKAIKVGQLGRRWTVSPLVPIASEIRVVLLDGEVMLCFAKRPAMVNGLKIFFISKETPMEYVLTPSEEAMARTAQEAIGLRVCAVDLAVLESGETKVLEVNSSITLRPYALHSEKHAARAKAVYEKIVKAMFT